MPLKLFPISSILKVGGQIIMPTAEPGPEPITQTPGKPGTCPVYDIIANCKCRPGLITCDRDGQCPACKKIEKC